MERKTISGIIFLIVFVLFIQLAISTEVKKTEITINMDRRQNFTLKIIDPSTEEVLQNLSERSDGAGVFMYKYYGLSNQVAFSIEFIKADGSKFSKIYGPYPAGTPVTIEKLSNEVQSTTGNSFENNSTEENLTGIVQPATASVTGLSIDQNTDTGSPSKLTKYIIGAIVLVAAAGLIAIFILKRGLPSFSISKSMNDKVAASVKKDPQLKIAEQKIENLQHELVKLKNEGRIQEIEKNIQHEREEIERLRRG